MAETLAEHRSDPFVEMLHASLGLREVSPRHLDDTAVAQPMLFVASLVRARRVARLADVVIGHSLGELAALVVAGALDFDAGLALVIERGAATAAAANQCPGGMAAVLGGGEGTADRLRAQTVADTGATLEIAARNGPDHVVVSGQAAALARIADLAPNEGATAVRLAVRGAFHSSLMAGARPRFRQALERTPIHQLSTPWMSTLDCRIHDTAHSIRDRLEQSLTSTVRWHEASERIRGGALVRLIDVGPGRVLARLHQHSTELEVVGRT